MQEIMFGVGICQVGTSGVQFGELQEATVTHNASIEPIYKRSVTPYSAYIEYPVDSFVNSRSITIRASYCRLSPANLYHVLGGATSTYHEAGDRLTVYSSSQMGEFALYLKNPADGSDLEMYFPRVISTGSFDMVLTQDDFTIIQPEFLALYEESSGIIFRMTQGG